MQMLAVSRSVETLLAPTIASAFLAMNSVLTEVAVMVRHCADACHLVIIKY